MRLTRNRLTGKIWFFGAGIERSRSERYHKAGHKRLPAHKVRNKNATLSMTAADRDFIEGAARRLGKSVNRMLGDLVEEAIRRGILEELATVRSIRNRLGGEGR